MCIRDSTDISVDLNYFVFDSEPLSSLAFNGTTVGSSSLGRYESTGYGLKLTKPFGFNKLSLSGNSTDVESDARITDTSQFRVGLERLLGKAVRVNVFFRRLTVSNNGGEDATSNLYGASLRVGVP